jgi:hypothetical protein
MDTLGDYRIDDLKTELKFCCFKYEIFVVYRICDILHDSLVNYEILVLYS